MSLEHNTVLNLRKTCIEWCTYVISPKTNQSEGLVDVGLTQTFPTFTPTIRCTGYNSVSLLGVGSPSIGSFIYTSKSKFSQGYSNN